MTDLSPGHLAWGNGEPCPFCGKPFPKADVNHLFVEHPKELEAVLWPKGVPE